MFGILKCVFWFQDQQHRGTSGLRVCMTIPMDSTKDISMVKLSANSEFVHLIMGRIIFPFPNS